MESTTTTTTAVGSLSSHLLSGCAATCGEGCVGNVGADAVGSPS